MKNLFAILLVLVMISCKSKIEEKNQNIHRKWMLVQFENFEKKKLIEKKCYLDLTDNKNASAMMGCNNIGFIYSLTDNNLISIGKIRTTHMYCEDHEIESKFLNVINSISAYNIEGHKLYLKTNSDKELIFVAEDWD